MWCLLHCLGRNYSITVLIKTQSSNSQLSGLPLIVGQTSGGALEFKLLQFCRVLGSVAATSNLNLHLWSLEEPLCWSVQLGRPQSQNKALSRATILIKMKLFEHIIFVFNLAHCSFLSISAEAGPGPWKMTVWLNAVKWHLWRMGTNNVNSNGNELYLRGCHRSGSCCLLFRAPAIIISLMV